MNITDLIGKTFVAVEYNKIDSILSFILPSGDSYKMYHYFNCCEYVVLEDINGELDWLVNSPILEAYSSSSRPEGPENRNYESITWTFYLIKTAKGSVWLRWVGESNGYYSEEVDIEFIEAPIQFPPTQS